MPRRKKNSRSGTRPGNCKLTEANRPVSWRAGHANSRGSSPSVGSNLIKPVKSFSCLSCPTTEARRSKHSQTFFPASQPPSLPHPSTPPTFTHLHAWVEREAGGALFPCRRFISYSSYFRWRWHLGSDPLMMYK